MIWAPRLSPNSAQGQQGETDALERAIESALGALIAVIHGADAVLSDVEAFAVRHEARHRARDAALADGAAVQS